MATSSDIDTSRGFSLPFGVWGMVWLTISVLGAAVYFYDGFGALWEAWQEPEYSHGPLIPILSFFMFLRHLKDVPENHGPVNDRWVGVAVVLLAVLVGAMGRLVNIPDIVAYAIIIWTGGILLISFGARVGWVFWPSVLHLVYMLPLPDSVYYKLSTWLQFISSELGVWFLKLIGIPVILEGNIIDLGVIQLLVAEACSGLRYLFPILSFSYIFAVLYKGPWWHKAVLLISAAPITVFMNSVRIAIAGYIVNNYGLSWVEGFSHFFEGWVIFVACVGILFLLARVMLFFNPKKMTLVDALDLDTDGLGTQAKRIRLLQPSKALIAATVAVLVMIPAFSLVPERGTEKIDRDSFVLFPRTLGEWKQDGAHRPLEPNIEFILGADDYHQVNLVKPGEEHGVDLFMAWYKQQTNESVHSPEVCLPGSGWEIAWIERTDIANQVGSDKPFNINRAIIQKNHTRMMVFYWFQQNDRRIASDIAIKFWMLVDGLKTGRTDGGIVRLTTLIGANESDAAAEARLLEVLKPVAAPLHRFMPAAKDQL